MKKYWTWGDDYLWTAQNLGDVKVLYKIVTQKAAAPVGLTFVDDPDVLVYDTIDGTTSTQAQYNAKYAPPAQTFGAPNNLVASANTTGVVLTWAAVVTAKYLVFRRSLTDKLDQPTSPYAWERLTSLTITATTFTDIYARELETYEYRVWAVDPQGMWSVIPSTVSAVVPAWLPQNELNHWSEKFDEGGWNCWYNDGATVSGAAGNQTVVFSAANKHLTQRIPVYPLNGKTYTFYWRVQGTAGEKIQFFAHDDENNSTYDYQHTLSGAVEDVVFTRTFTTNGRIMRVGVNTYGTGTNSRSLKVLRHISAAGNVVGTIVQNYTPTYAPGTTWQEPLSLTNTYYGTANSLTVNSWHRSFDATVASLRIATDKDVIIGPVRSISRGHHISAAVGHVRITVLKGHRFYSLNPMKSGRYYGRAIAADYAYRLVIEGGYWERTSGVKGGFFKGRSATECYKVRYNRVRDLDGRYVDDNGKHIESSYGTASGNRPVGVPLGWESVQMAYLYCMLNHDETPYSPYDMLNAEVSYNDCVNRPGFSRHEDVVNLHAARGAVNDPFWIHHNVIWVVGPDDYILRKNGDWSQPWNYGRVMTFFNVAVTTTAGIAQGAATLPVQALGGVIRQNAQIVLSNGVTVVASAQANKDSTSIPIANAPGAVPAGSTATVATSDGPGTASHTAILLSDLFSHNSSFLQKNPANVLSENNLVIGVGAIISIQAGYNQIFKNETILSSGKMMSGHGPATTHRRAGVQITDYNVNGTALDLVTNTQVKVWRDNYFQNLKVGVQGTNSIGLGSSSPTSLATGNVIIGVPTPEQEWEAHGAFQRDVIAPALAAI